MPATTAERTTATAEVTNVRFAPATSSSTGGYHVIRPSDEPSFPVGPRHDAPGALASGLTNLFMAAVRAERDGFRQPDRTTVDRAISLMAELSDSFPKELERAALSVAPDGSISIVVSFAAFEADVTVPSNGGLLDVSLYSSQTGALAEEQCVSPGAARHFIVRGL